MDADAVTDANSFDVSGTSVAVLQGFLDPIPIVPIEEAIETLRGYCPDCSPQVAHNTLIANKWEVAQLHIAGFTDEDYKCAIRIFTAEEPYPFFRWINAPFFSKVNPILFVSIACVLVLMRLGQRRSKFSLRLHAPYVKLLMRAIQALMSLPQFAYEGVGYRGLKLDGNEELKKKYLSHKTAFVVGELMTFAAFMSVSTDDSVADDFGDYVFFVFVKVRGARIAVLSQLPKEAEILVPPPSVFRIKAVAKFGGKLTITLEQESCPLSYLSQAAATPVSLGPPVASVVSPVSTVISGGHAAAQAAPVLSHLSSLSVDQVSLLVRIPDLAPLSRLCASSCFFPPC